jgi:preprotein translocase subunit YajC
MNLFALGQLMQDAAFPSLMAMGTPLQGGTAGLIQGLVPFALVLGIFYFVILLPMKRKQQKVDAFLAELKVGDRVVTSGGIFGNITGITEQAIQLQIAEKVRVQVSRSAIVGYQGQEPVTTEGQS